MNSGVGRAYGWVSELCIHIGLCGYIGVGIVPAWERQVPWQEVVDPTDGVIRDPVEDVLEIDLRVESVELGGAEQGVDGCGTFFSSTRTGEEEDDMTASGASDGVG